MHTIDFSKIKKNTCHKVLDVGCGDGRHLQVASQFGYTQLYGIDLDEKSLEKAQTRLKHQKPTLSVGNIQSLAFPQNSFEIVICSEVLEHVDDVEKSLKNLYKVTKKGGVCAISVPRFWTEKICWLLSKEYFQTPGGHVRIFKKKDLKKAIEKTGFTIIDMHYAHAFHSPYWWLKCLFWKSQNNNPLIKSFETFLIKCMYKYSLSSHPLERYLNPFLGKSLVLYASK